MQKCQDNLNLQYTSFSKTNLTFAREVSKAFWAGTEPRNKRADVRTIALKYSKPNYSRAKNERAKNTIQPKE